MGRLVVGIELIFLIAALSIPMLGFSIAPFFALTPLLFLTFLPLIGGSMIWNFKDIYQSFLDAFSPVKLPGKSRKSLLIWEFFEKTALTGGILGILLSAVLALSGSELKNNTEPITKFMPFIILFGIYSILFGLVFRILREAVRFLSSESLRELNLEISKTFCSEYNISPREKEVIELMLAGQTYKEIAENLNISIKTIKCHIHNVYEKTTSANRVDLIRLLQFQDKTTG